MGKEKKFIQSLHNATKRNYLERMINKKVDCMKVAKEYGKGYWDGPRKYGYGGYKYIKDRWKNLALKIIKNYKLKNNSKIIDFGCGKGFLLYEIQKINPKIKIYGFDISKYAIKNSKKEVKRNLFVHDVAKKLKFKKNYFNLAISLGVFHNLNQKNLNNALSEFSRVSKKNYLMVESFSNNKELFNLQCWALTCNCFFSFDDWKYYFKKNKYFGDYEFITFK